MKVAERRAGGVEFNRAMPIGFFLVRRSALVSLARFSAEKDT
jgi:hypothetical protein